MELSFKNKFGQKIFKVALDGGFDCLTVMALLHMVGARSVQPQVAVTLLATELIN